MSGLTAGGMASLFGTMFVLSLVPGPSVFAVAARSISSGLLHGVITILGIVVANFVFVLMVTFGIASIAGPMGQFFGWIKILGSVYLFWLGIALFRAKVRTTEISGIKEPSWISNFLCGLLITLGAPRAILFYLSVLPVYVDLPNATLLDVCWIMVVAGLSVGGAKFVYAAMAHRSRVLLQSNRARRSMNLAAGTVMILTGLLLLTKN